MKYRGILKELASELRSNPASTRDSLLVLLDEHAKRMNRSTRFSAWCMLADAYRYVGQTNEAVALIESALALTHTGDNPKIIAYLTHTLAVLNLQSNPERALALAKDALNIRRNSGGQPADVSHTLNAIGSALMSLGRYSEAFTVWNECREIRAKLGNVLWIASVNQNVGGALYEMRRYDDAITVYRYAEEQYQLVGDVLGRAGVKNGIAMVLMETGRTQEALALLEEAEALIPPGVTGPRTYIRGNVACALYQAGRYQDAHQVLSDVIGGDEATLVNSITLNESRAMMKILYALGRVNDAIEWIQVALPQLDDLGSPPHVVDFLLEASNIYAAIENIPNAYSFLRRAVERNEQLLLEERRVITHNAAQPTREAYETLLRAAFPALSDGEVKACVLFAAGHGTKDVAGILSYSVRSVESIRQRASKKMGLTSSTELEVAVISIIHPLSSQAQHRNS